MGEKRLPDVYFSTDFRVLLEIGRWDLAGREGHYLGNERLMAKLPTSLGLTARELFVSVQRLQRAGYVDAAEMSGMGWQNFEVRGLTPAGLREVGAWPKADDLAAVLNRALDSQARELERTDPEKGRKVRAIASAVADVGTDFAAKLAAELLKHLGVP